MAGKFSACSQFKVGYQIQIKHCTEGEDEWWNSERIP